MNKCSKLRDVINGRPLGETQFRPAKSNEIRLMMTTRGFNDVTSILDPCDGVDQWPEKKRGKEILKLLKNIDFAFELSLHLRNLIRM